jgi:CRP-like cAMP-binding protein
MSQAQSRPAVHRVSLLDLEPDLARDVAPDAQRALRRRTLVPTADLRPGPFVPHELDGISGTLAGFLVVRGLVVRDVLVAGGMTSDVLGPGDILSVGSSDDELVPTRVRWTACAASHVALIDDRVLELLEHTPPIAARLLLRAARQVSRLAVLRGISQLPRVEQRLLALFWLLAERWGRVTPDGVVVPMALTHETLGRMVGARRPTVSLALKDLARDGTVVRRPDGSWALDRAALERLRPVESPFSPPDVALVPVGGAD